MIEGGKPWTRLTLPRFSQRQPWPISRLTAFARFTARPGKTYYFRPRITYSTSRPRAANPNLDLDPLNPDEGHFPAPHSG
jgi:hypothetical protein